MAEVCQPSKFTEDVSSQGFLAPTLSNETPSIVKALTSQKYTVMVDAADIDPSSPFKFTVDLAALGVEVRNACNVELKSLAFPSVAGQPWIGLDIRQVTNGSVFHTSGANPFATVFFPAACAPGTIMVAKGADHVRNLGGIDPPLRRLARLDCAFVKHGGAALTPDDTGNVTSFQFILELTGKVVGNSPALESSVIDARPHASQLAYR